MIQPCGVRLAGTGSAVPDTTLTNNDLARILDTSDEWIAQRTGLRERRVGFRPLFLGAQVGAAHGAGRRTPQPRVGAFDVEDVAARVQLAARLPGRHGLHAHGAVVGLLALAGLGRRDHLVARHGGVREARAHNAHLLREELGDGVIVDALPDRARDDKVADHDDKHERAGDEGRDDDDRERPRAVVDCSR
jgi:hypothetical protein